jgi:hypothetical protein
VAYRKSVQFSAVAYDQADQVFSPTPAFIWCASGGGNITDWGRYTAVRRKGGRFRVEAWSAGVWGVAEVRVKAQSGVRRWFDMLRRKKEPDLRRAPGQLTLDLGGASPRGNAVAQGALLLTANGGLETAKGFSLPTGAVYDLSLRYSNDGAPEKVSVSVDDVAVGVVTTTSTGSGGYGWNNFVEAPVARVGLRGGSHTVRLVVSETDKYGVELDVVRLTRVEAP